jgi:hypothetical protein
MTKQNFLSTKQLCAGFGVSAVTISNWRKGTPGKTALPVAEHPGYGVRFDPAVIKAWAKEHGLKFSVAAAQAVGASTPGPKPTVAAKKKDAPAASSGKKTMTKAKPDFGRKLAERLSPTRGQERRRTAA